MIRHFCVLNEVFAAFIHPLGLQKVPKTQRAALMAARCKLRTESTCKRLNCSSSGASARSFGAPLPCFYVRLHLHMIISLKVMSDELAEQNN